MRAGRPEFELAVHEYAFDALDLGPLERAVTPEPSAA
jgi:hypothetical protein